MRTPFIVKALMAKRRGSSGPEEVLVFLENDGSESLKECSRCYMDDWGYYFNHLGQQGQRIGMHCKAVDREFLAAQFLFGSKIVSKCFLYSDGFAFFWNADFCNFLNFL